MTRFFILLFLVLQFCTSLAFAEKEVPLSQDEAEAYPGLSEIIPETSRLSELANASAQSLKSLSETAPLEKLLLKAKERHLSLESRLESYGPIENWYFDRQLEVGSLLKDFDSDLDRLQMRISDQLRETDQIFTEWQGRKDYWEGWEKYLRDSGVSLAPDSFNRARNIISETLVLAKENNQPLLELQKRVSTLQEKVQGQIGEQEAALNKLRGDLFRRNAHSFFSRVYWRQFTLDLWEGVRQELWLSYRFQEDFYRQNALFIGLQIIFALGVTYFIHRFRETIARSKRWQIFSDHAVATGLFASVVFVSFFYQGLPPLFRLALAVVGLLSAVKLCIGIHRIGPTRFYLYTFSFLALLTLALRLAWLPLPCYRAYMALIGLVLLGLLTMVAKKPGFRRSLKVKVLVRLTGFILFFSLAANLSGYVALSFRLLESFMESVVVILFTLLAYQVGLGGLALLISRATSSRSRAVMRFGRGFQRRFERVFGVFLVGYSGFYLTAVWGLYSSPGEAWAALAGYTWVVADYEVSIHLILQVLLVIYLSLELSWFLQTLLERHLFDRRQYDRGIRDAVKKLLHYSLVLVGLLVAAGLAGFELRNFMVLAGAFGIGIGFGLQDIVNNFLSGIILLFERPIKVGDAVLVDGEFGTVLRIGLRSTVVETLDKAELIVPNSKLISQKLTNWTLTTRSVCITIPVGVAYGSDLEEVLEILVNAGKQHPEVLAVPEPSPLFIRFGDSALDFELRVWIKDVDKRMNIKSSLLLYIERKFREAGVEVPFPQQDLHLRTLPPEMLPDEEGGHN